ncbi:MAG: D-aminoacylase [Proteobacteria bacterium]|nr:D-aminoacylase [Pseudomonadota bacterium]
MPRLACSIAQLAILFLLSACASTNPPVALSASFDIVIRNGLVLDGTGTPARMGDVAIRDGRLASIGEVAGTGVREIDAAGLYVSPGWIDMMDQSGSVLLENGHAPNKIHMGVTTVIAGEEGTPVPADRIGAYFDRLESQGISVNFGTYYSATQARVAVLGDTAIDPGDADLEKMKRLVATAMEAGAFGITTALIYPPASYHKTENLIELSKVAANYGGIYATHLRDEGRNLIAAVEEAVRIGEESGAGVEIFHLKAAYRPGWGTLMADAIATIEAARERGVDVTADVYPYVAGGTGLEVAIPNWIFDKGMDVALDRMRNPEIVQRIRQELSEGIQDGWTNLVYSSGGWENVVLVNSRTDEYSRYHNRNMKDIGTELGTDPANVAIDIILAAAPERPVALFFMMSERDVELAIRQPWVSIGSDAAASLVAGGTDALGLPHPRSYGTFPRIIAEYVRNRGVLSLPEAIRRMTSWPATRMGMDDRGALHAGFAADVTIFDFEGVEDSATWENPTAIPMGVKYVLVNGKLVLDGGEHTGETPGTVLRGAGALSAQ